MTLTTFIGAVLGLLFLGALIMTQLESPWRNWRVWLAISLAGIPLFGLVLGLLANAPILMFGVVAMACFQAGRSGRWRR